MKLKQMNWRYFRNFSKGEIKCYHIDKRGYARMVLIETIGSTQVHKPAGLIEAALLVPDKGEVELSASEAREEFDYLLESKQAEYLPKSSCHKLTEYFEFTGEEKKLENGVVVKRVRRIKKDHPLIKVGELGGWIEKASNLLDDAVVLNEAMVFGNAMVLDEAVVSMWATVFGNAQVKDSSEVSGIAIVGGGAEVRDEAVVSGCSRVCGGAVVEGKAIAFDEFLFNNETLSE